MRGENSSYSNSQTTGSYGSPQVEKGQLPLYGQPLYHSEVRKPEEQTPATEPTRNIEGQLELDLKK